MMLLVLLLLNAAPSMVLQRHTRIRLRNGLIIRRNKFHKLPAYANEKAFKA